MRANLLKHFLRKMRDKERKQAEEAESYALLRVMFDQSSSLISVLKPDGTVLDINSSAFDVIGGTKSEAIGKPFWETLAWVHSPELQERLRQAIKSAAQGEFVSFEATHPTADGKLIYVDFSLKPVKDDDGNVVLLLPEGRDITKRREAEEALREVAVKYRIVADNTYNWEFWLSPAQSFIYTSPSCRRISGHGAEEFNADPGLLRSIIHPDDRHLWTDHRHDITQTKALGELELRIVRPDGDIRWVHHVCIPVFDDNGNHLGTRGSFSDITERKQAEEKNLRLAVMVESSDDAIVGKTLDGIITSWNRGAEKILGYSEDEVLGKPITMLIPAENVDEVLQMDERLRHGEHIEHFETVRRRKDGQLIHMSLSYSPIRDAQGRVVAVSTIGRDITERKEMEQMKDEMISAVSHEMRTPLTAMLGYTEFMLDNEVPADQQREYLRITLHESEKLNELIGNFLDLQRLRSRKETVTWRPLPLQPLLEETVALFTRVSERHHITLDCPSDLPQICGDDKQLRQVFNNLVSNAVKYSPQGGAVRLAARREKDSVVITVRDEGIGISPQALERIFERFYRVNNTACRVFGGTGLGLALVREIVTAHGGKVWVESALGRGSTFFVSLPVA